MEGRDHVQGHRMVWLGGFRASRASIMGGPKSES